MSELPAGARDAFESEFEFALRTHLAALASGECTEDEFLREFLDLRERMPNIAATALAQIDAAHEQGYLQSDRCLSIKAKILRHECDDRAYGTTVELACDPATPDWALQQRLTRIESARAYNHSRQGDTQPTHEPSPIPDDTQDMVLKLEAPEAPSAAPRGVEIGSVLVNRYVIEAVIGHGGMGTVFKALDRTRLALAEGHRHVAVKFLDERISRNPEVLADLRREFYCAQALSHPNVVKVYELHHEGDIAFYTMELLEGELLSSVLLRTHPLSLARPHAWTIIREIGAGVAHAHSRTVVHGDLKPQNIMITASGEVRILDFGGSSTTPRPVTEADLLQRDQFRTATPAYTCCELLDGHRADPRDDLYALGCLSYELLAGKHPYQRLRSTEARDLGMHPLRPRGMTNRQWRAVQTSLSWHRESRSLEVAGWLAELGLEPLAKRLPPPHALDAVLPPRMNGGALPQVALMASLVAALGLWIAFSNAPIGAKLRGTPPAAAQTSSPTDLEPVPPQLTAASDLNPAAQLKPVAYVVPPLLPQLQSSGLTDENALTLGSTPTSPLTGARASGTARIPISVSAYPVNSGDHFVQVDVRRADESGGNGSFAWWTEASSAKPGDDFVAQDRTVQVFQKGKRLAHLFIRLVPNASRTRAQTFYVVIGKSGAGTSLNPITRTAVLIPPFS